VIKLAVLILSLASCTTAGIGWQSLGPEQQQAALDNIADRCGVRRTLFEIHDSIHVSLKPLPGEPYEAFDCALAGINQYRGVNLGFVGNEQRREAE
jgi:hypothetical protein